MIPLLRVAQQVQEAPVGASGHLRPTEAPYSRFGQNRCSKDM